MAGYRISELSLLTTPTTGTLFLVTDIAGGVPYISKQITMQRISDKIEEIILYNGPSQICRLDSNSKLPQDSYDIAYISDTIGISAKADDIHTHTISEITDINIITSDIATNASDIVTLSGDVSTNASDIATNTTNISTNASNIATLSGDIATNTTNISTNASNISTNATDISTNASDITTLSGDIATNANDIATLSGDVSTNANDIATNASNISTNATDISTLSGDIATNASNISTNASNISTNATDISTNASDIATLSGDIATNASDIVTLSSEIGLLSGSDSVLASNIVTLSSDVITLSSTVDNLNPTNINSLISDISTNASDIVTLSGDIATNTNDIAALSAGSGSSTSHTHLLSAITDAGDAGLYDVGVGPNNIIQLDSGASLPAVDASNLLNIPVESAVMDYNRGTLNPHLGAYPEQPFRSVDSDFTAFLRVRDSVLQVVGPESTTSISVGIVPYDDPGESDIEFILPGGLRLSSFSGDSDMKGVNRLPIYQQYRGALGSNPTNILIDGGTF